MDCPHCHKPMQLVKETKHESLYKCPICHRTELRKNNKPIAELKEN